MWNNINDLFSNNFKFVLISYIKYLIFVKYLIKQLADKRT